MTYALKKWLMGLLSPLGLVWAVLVALALSELLRRRWRPGILAGLCAGGLYLFGSTPLPARLLADLESPWLHGPLEEVAQADAIVMLGGMLRHSPADAFSADFYDAVDRFITAAELARLGKAPVLILGGGHPGGAPDDVRESEYLKRWFESWLPKKAEILQLGKCMDTHDESVQVARIAKERGWKSVILVTSAAHMRRAAGLFRKAGLDPICVACDFEGTASLLDWENNPRRIFNPFPNAGGFKLMGVYLHEEVGWWYYRLRGWIEP